MAEQRTCGEALAANAALPAALGTLTDSVAEVLERHLTALDLGDDNAWAERDVYRTLVEHHRHTAARLHATAEEMRRAGDLPPARHDPALLASEVAADAFGRLVAAEETLLSLLRDRLREDRQMLGDMQRAA